MQPRIAPQSTTVMLCFLCVVITLAHTTTSTPDGSLWYRIGHFTDASSEDIWNGRWYPLLTNMFLHSDFTHGLGFTHLLFDVIALYMLGSLVEQTLGPIWYLLFIAASAAVTFCVELAWSGNLGMGASGVAYALFGLLWAGRFRFPEWQVLANAYNFRIMIAWGIYCIVMTQIGLLTIANATHFGGLAFGYCVGMLCFGRRRRWAWIAPILAVLAVGVMGLTWVPWSADWLWWKAARAFDAQQYRQAVVYWTRSLKHGAPPEDTWHNIAASWHNQGVDDYNSGNQAALATDQARENAADAKAGGPVGQ